MSTDFLKHTISLLWWQRVVNLFPLLTTVIQLFNRRSYEHCNLRQLERKGGGQVSSDNKVWCGYDRPSGLKEDNKGVKRKKKFIWLNNNKKTNNWLLDRHVHIYIWGKKGSDRADQATCFIEHWSIKDWSGGEWGEKMSRQSNSTVYSNAPIDFAQCRLSEQ